MEKQEGAHCLNGTQHNLQMGMEKAKLHYSKGLEMEKQVGPCLDSYLHKQKQDGPCLKSYLKKVGKEIDQKYSLTNSHWTNYNMIVEI